MVLANAAKTALEFEEAKSKKEQGSDSQAMLTVSKLLEKSYTHMYKTIQDFVGKDMDWKNSALDRLDQVLFK